VCIFVQKHLYFRKINISYNCKKKDLEICAIQLETKSSELIMLSLNTAPTEDFSQFIKIQIIL
jgi:hypothetical protein